MSKRRKKSLCISWKRRQATILCSSWVFSICLTPPLASPWIEDAKLNVPLAFPKFRWSTGGPLLHLGSPLIQPNFTSHDLVSSRKPWCYWSRYVSCFLKSSANSGKRRCRWKAVMFSTSFSVLSNLGWRYGSLAFCGTVWGNIFLQELSVFIYHNPCAYIMTDRNSCGSWILKRF